METIVLGIDPGLAQTGYGVIAAEPSRYRYIDHGTIATKPDEEGYGARLAAIFDELSEVIARHMPAAAGVELLYFAKNSTSAIPVAQARGVILLALHRAGVPTFEFPPQEIKQAITGSGRADKGQVQELVRILLGLTHVPKPDHAADALAAAICSYHHFSARERIEAARV